MPKLDKAGEGSGIKIGKGVYLSTVTIIGYTDKSNHPRWKGQREVTYMKSGDPAELWLEIATKDDNDFERNQMFFGYYKTDPVTGKIKGWKAWGNSVQEFLNVFFTHEELETKLNEDYSIPESTLKELIGKRYMKVSFVSGTYEKDGETKPSYRDWMKVFPEGTSAEEITQIWEKASVNLKTYTPDVIDQLQKDDESTKFKFGANSEENVKYSDKDII